MPMLSFLRKALRPRNPLRLAWHHAKALCAALRYGFPARKLAVIGVTGTDGKTTTVAMTAHILAHAEVACGALSTAFLQVKGDRRWNATQKTSPSPFLIQRFLRDLVRAGCTHAILECSSHGLVQGRLRYTWPRIASVTNTSMEHLDYHGTMAQYRRDKAILFRMLHGKGTKVLNAQDETFESYSRIPSEQTIAYSMEVPSSKFQVPNNDERALFLSLCHIRSSSRGTVATLQAQKNNVAVGTWNLELGIPGAFNLENALCSIGCANAAGVPLETCVEALRSYAGTPGRLERINEGQPFAVFVDFTVTPAAYEKTLRALREMTPQGGRLLVLTGSCGDRMPEKRPIIGRICSRFADVLIVTNEDPYGEDPEKIMEEVWAGIDAEKTEAHRISDRREAIAFLLGKAQVGDTVLLCGKGSDTTMWTALGQIPWDERAIVRSLLRERRSSY
jgi:UDP-N-acetylmuramoyl-L-alanyl-D-glutamate--2,6-diaminopimelate ligase